MTTDSGDSAALITAKTFSVQIRPDLISCCPTMDLVALTTVEERVEVYRFGGQRAFAVQRKEPGVSVESLCWKYNGQYLAVSWSDGLVDVVSSETGGTLQNFRQVTMSSTGGDEKSARSGPVQCLGWGLSLVEPHPPKPSKQTPGFEHTEIDPDAFLDKELNLDALGLAAELPDQLAQFDATDLMPKLPVLPVIQSAFGAKTKASSAEIFASQISLDAALHKGSTRELHAVNAFLLTEPKGSLRLILYDSLGIGNVPLQNLPVTSQLRYLKHASHPLAHCHVLLSEVSLPGNSAQLALVPLALRFLRFAGKNVHFIDFKTAQLEMLVQYTGECLQAIHHHWKHAQELPNRFKANIEETLSEKGEPNLVQSLYQFAALGYWTPSLKEWLLEELGDRGLKRWDHSIAQGYTKVLELLQESLLPALDRCSIVLSSLQGLAQYHEHSPAFDVSLSSFPTILDIIKCIRLVAHHLIVWASEEFQRFNAFSAWLKHMIAVLRADPATVAGEDLYEDDPNIEYHFVLAYVQGPMQKSKLDAFFAPPDNELEAVTSANIYEETKKALTLFKEKWVMQSKLLNLPAYYRNWSGHNRALIEQITAWQRSNTILPGGFVVADGKSKHHDLRMVSETTDDSILTFVATVAEKQPSQVVLLRITHSRLFDEVPNSVKACDAMVLDFDSNEIIDLKFLDDQNLLLLAQTSNNKEDADKTTHLIQYPYRHHQDSADLGYRPVQVALKDMTLSKGAFPKHKTKISLSDAKSISTYVKQEFQLKQDSFTPHRLHVTGRKHRRVCVIVAENQKQMRIYDLSEPNSSAQPRADKVVDIKMKE